jgi:hypothetical protein
VNQALRKNAEDLLKERQRMTQENARRKILTTSQPPAIFTGVQATNFTANQV